MFVVESNGLGGPLYHKDQVPEHFRESFIVKGYRSPKSSPFQCILSLFNATNETLNFWTHFLPSWYFMWVLKGLSETLDFKSDPYTWPLLAYMCTSVVYPLASSTAHTFNTMSDYARHICFFLDYSAIAAQGLSVAIVYRAYCFPTDLKGTWIGDNFVNIAVVNALLCIVFSCHTRFMKPSTFRKVLRLGALGVPCIYDTIPITYRLLFGSDAEMKLDSFNHHMIGLLLMYLSGLLYGAHFPERMCPGKFDIIGHSHQLFHVCTILGTMEQMQGILTDMRQQKEELNNSWEFKDVTSSIGTVGMILCINTTIIILFSIRLYQKSSKTKIS